MKRLQLACDGSDWRMMLRTAHVDLTSTQKMSKSDGKKRHLLKLTYFVLFAMIKQILACMEQIVCLMGLVIVLQVLRAKCAKYLQMVTVRAAKVRKGISSFAHKIFTKTNSIKQVFVMFILTHRFLTMTAVTAAGKHAKIQKSTCVEMGLFRVTEAYSLMGELDFLIVPTLAIVPNFLGQKLFMTSLRGVKLNVVVI